MNILSVVWLASICDVSFAFTHHISRVSSANIQPRSIPTSRSSLSKPKTTLKMSSIGDLFSGITGSAPAKLDPPLELIEQTTLDPSKSNVDLGCVYKASKDGWSAVDFHKCVDGRGSAFVVALISSGKRFGGYNPLGWMSTDDYGSSNAAFLWMSSKNKSIKVPILMGGNTAIYDYATGGPCFGAADLLIGPPKAAIMGGFAGPDMMDTSLNSGSLRECSSSPGGAYDCPPDNCGWPYGRSKIIELEVYCNLNVNPGSSMSGGSKWWPF